MGKIVVTDNLTLDGVMQAPGRPDEDTRDGFEHGGWAVPYADQVMAEVMGQAMAKGGPLVLGAGRRLFPDDTEVDLRLTHSVTTTTGVIIATYQPADAK